MKSIVLFSLIVWSSSVTSVEIVGFFLKTDGDAQAMFRIAFELAEKYGIHVHGEKIGYRIHLLDDDVNGFNEMDTLCQTLHNMTESDLVGLVGATSSSSARFVASFAGQIGLPVVTYAATSSELSNRQLYPTLYRINPSNELLAAAIIQLFNYFNWMSCLLIVSNDEYSYDGARVLRERYHQQLIIVDQILFDSHTNSFNVNLTHTLNKSLSRIILIWACRNTTNNMIRQAIDQDAFPNDFIWITTSQINEKSFSDLRRLQGLFSVLPIVTDENYLRMNLTLRKAVCERWTMNETACLDTIYNLNDLAFYTFDAAWTFIDALRRWKTDDLTPRMQRSPCCFNNRLVNQTKYIEYLDSTSFLGITGCVQFSTDYARNRINCTFYGLYRLQEDPSNRTIFSKRLLVWNSSHSEWDQSSASNHSILSEKLLDYHDLHGEELRILVHVAPPFIIQVNCTNPYHTECPNINKRRFILPANNSAEKIYGFLVDFLIELQKNLGLTYVIDIADANTSYHHLALKVAGDHPTYDLVMSAIRITSKRMNIVDFTTPIFEHYLRIITRKEMVYPTMKIWSFFMLFDSTVWLAIFISILYSGILIYFFERDQMSVSDSSRWIPKELVSVMRIITSVLVMNGDVPLRKNYSRMTVLGLYGLGALLMAVYTANLSSFLTLSRVQPIISGIDDIKNGLVPLDRIGIVTNSAVSDYFETFISQNYRRLDSPDEIYPLLINRSIDTAIWTGPVLEYAVDHYYCTQLMTTGLGFVKSSFAFVIPKGWKYKHHLDLEILRMRESEQFEQFETKWFGRRKCIPYVNDPNEESSFVGIEPLPITVMAGIFTAFFLFTLVCLFSYAWDSRVYLIRPVQRINSNF